MSARLEVSLFGTCITRVIGAETVDIRGAKHRALLAILATAPMGRRTRTYLQQILWGDASYDSGHQNLRRALSDLRSLMGDTFVELIHTTNTDIELNIAHVAYLGDPAKGVFLEDLNVRERGFADWVQSVRADPSQVAALTRVASPARTGRMRPRITALPLRVLAEDTELSVLADWVSEEACRSLSRSNILTVISHLSSRAMAAQRFDLEKVRTILDVDYLITGTLRRHGSDLVADFDFMEVATGQILWNRHVSAPAGGFAELIQGRLSNIIQSVGRSIAETAIAYVRDRPLPQIEDHNLLIAGVSLMHKRQMRDFLKSRELLNEAARRAPKSSETAAWLGKWYVLSVFNGWTIDRMGDTQKALDHTARALDIDPESSFSLTIDGFAHNNLMQDMAMAEARYNAALDINPNESLSWLLRGTLMAFQDDGMAAIRGTDTARRLSPIDPFGYFYDSLAATAHLAAEQYDKALEFADKSLTMNDRHLSTLRAKITSLYHLGRHEEARAAASELMRRSPDFRVEDYRRSHPSSRHKLGQRVIEALSGAGVS